MSKSIAHDAVRNALLLAVIANQPLLVLTGEQGDVPTYPGPGWVKILDNDLRWQAVESTSPAAKQLPNRTLSRVYNGKAINVVTSLDPLCHITKSVFSDEKADQGMHVVMALPGSELPESVRCRMVAAVDLSRLSPSSVKALLDSIVEDDEFSPENVAALRAQFDRVIDGISPAFANRLAKAIRATCPDTVEFMERVSIGIMPTFGFGASPRVALNVLRVSAAHAVLAGRDYVRSSDLVDVFPLVVSHSITWGAATPKPGTASALTQIAEWAVSI
jgi:hypothetical protein